MKLVIDLPLPFAIAPIRSRTTSQAQGILEVAEATGDNFPLAVSLIASASLSVHDFLCSTLLGCC